MKPLTQDDVLRHERAIDAAGKTGFQELADFDRALFEAIQSFPFDAERDDYCGNCAEALQSHLASLGFTGFHHHAHGHSFVANDEYIVDVWPDNKPKVWRKDDQILCNSAYATFNDHPTSRGHSCWCGDPAFGPHEHIGVPKEATPKNGCGLQI